MNATMPPKDDQAALWNGAAGQAWVDAQAVLDQVLAPFEAVLVEAVTANAARRVLDVGCGTGATTLAIARSLGAEGQCTGVDISAPMIAAARARAERSRLPASFVCADAQTYPFAPADFDMIVSRFGVMFFDDPVAAFANLCKAARPDAGLRLIAWRSAAENPFMTAAERAAAPLLPSLPPRETDAPGQFAFADAQRVRRILAQSGWADIDVRPIDVVCAFPQRALDLYLTKLGPLGRILAEADEPTRARIVAAVRPAFDSYVQGDEVRFDAACWIIGARSPA
jgi:SAM-dependent methyltransferase